QQVGNAIPPRLGAYILAAAVYGMRPCQADLDRAIRSWKFANEGEGSVGLEESDGREGLAFGFDDVLPLWGVDLDDLLDRSRGGALNHR
ncbi:hypothetical protein, partial [Nocardia farcinica]|uniref:hypothetical protein n=1 Tax=Nocardia farcinica TaxID=37329 RepID=UPI001C0F00DC